MYIVREAKGEGVDKIILGHEFEAEVMQVRKYWILKTFILNLQIQSVALLKQLQDCFSFRCFMMIRFFETGLERDCRY